MRNHFKIVACLVFVAGIVSMIVNPVFAYTNGPLDGRTGSPVDGKTCNDDCHTSYTLNSGTAAFSISAPGSYTDGEALSITVAFSSSSTSKHGFELSALDAGNNKVGTFVAVDSTSTQTTDGSYIKHTSAGTANSNWSVQWTAPSSGATDPVTFYAAGNEANGDLTNQNDYIYTATAQASSAATTPVATPTLPPLPSPGASPTLPPPPTLPPLPSPGVSPSLPPLPTLPPAPSPVASPTPSECDPESIAIDLKRLKLKFGQSDMVTITVTGADDCKSEGATVNAAVKTGKNRVKISSTTATTDVNGMAYFTIAAGKKNGNAKIVFTVEDSEGKTYKTFVVVQVRKK